MHGLVLLWFDYGVTVNSNNSILSVLLVQTFFFHFRKISVEDFAAGWSCNSRRLTRWGMWALYIYLIITLHIFKKFMLWLLSGKTGNWCFLLLLCLIKVASCLAHFLLRNQFTGARPNLCEFFPLFSNRWLFCQKVFIFFLNITMQNRLFVSVFH